MKKTYLKGMSIEQLATWCEQQGETKYRGQQIFEWMYRHGVFSSKEMNNLNNTFRSFIHENCIIRTLELKESYKSNIDETTKFLFKTKNGQLIETISMIDGKRHTVCLSSQVGCALKCSFCKTGEKGLIDNLNTGEIVDQLILVREYIAKPITNVVFMGMGEPFQNYKNVINSSKIFHDPRGFNLASERITISTVGIINKIKQYIKEKHKYKLAISLNASKNSTRSEIMPINKKWPIEELIKVSKLYSQHKRQIMFEYVLLKGINDSEKNAYELAALLKGIPCKLNIIPYNETDSTFYRPDNKNIQKFSKILFELRDQYRVLIRWSKGQDINAGCGQLAGEQY